MTGETSAAIDPANRFRLDGEVAVVTGGAGAVPASLVGLGPATSTFRRERGFAA
jgi:hypothetical protein